MPARTRYLKAEWESRRLSVNHMCRKGIFTSEMSCLAGLFQQRNDGEPHPVCRTKDKDGMSKEGTPAKVPGLRQQHYRQEGGTGFQAVLKQKHLQNSNTTCTSSIKDLTSFSCSCDPVSSHHPTVTPPLSDLLRSRNVIGVRHRPSGSGLFLRHNRVSQPTASSRHLRSRVIALASPEALITQAH